MNTVQKKIVLGCTLQGRYDLPHASDEGLQTTVWVFDQTQEFVTQEMLFR